MRYAIKKHRRAERVPFDTFFFDTFLLTFDTFYYHHLTLFAKNSSVNVNFVCFGFTRLICFLDFFYGKTGSGKTRTAFEEFPKIYTPLSYKWWEGYEGQTEVLIDDFRKDWCKFHELLKLLDRYPFKVEAKGSHHQLMATTIIITAPYPPQYMYDTREDIEQLLRRIRVVQEFPIDEEVKKGLECPKKKEKE